MKSNIPTQVLTSFTVKFVLGTLNPNPDLSLKSNGMLRPCFCRYAKLNSEPAISRNNPVKLLRLYLSHSIFSSSWKVLRPSISSSPMVQSSVYNFRVLSRYNKIHDKYDFFSKILRTSHRTIEINVKFKSYTRFVYQLTPFWQRSRVIGHCRHAVRNVSPKSHRIFNVYCPLKVKLVPLILYKHNLVYYLHVTHNSLMLTSNFSLILLSQ